VLLSLLDHFSDISIFIFSRIPGPDPAATRFSKWKWTTQAFSFPPPQPHTHTPTMGVLAPPYPTFTKVSLTLDDYDFSSQCALLPRCEQNGSQEQSGPRGWLHVQSNRPTSVIFHFFPGPATELSCRYFKCLRAFIVIGSSGISNSPCGRHEAQVMKKNFNRIPCRIPWLSCKVSPPEYRTHCSFYHIS